jgi:hypothetical protein
LRSDQVCLHDASLLNIADSLDIDYDSISHALTLTILWSKSPSILYDPVLGTTTEQVWPLNVRKASENDRVEVGILSSSKANDAHDLQLSGFLTVIGEDNEPKATRFYFPSRHHSLHHHQQATQKYTVSIQQPQGLHPTLQISFPAGSSSAALSWPESRPVNSQCALQSYILLPSHIFADEYAFKSGDPLFAETHNIKATHAISGETDLEAPDYVVKKWGSSLLVELATPSINDTTAPPPHPSEWKVTIPLHLRYLSPSPTGETVVSMPWPVVYWACTAEEGTKFPVNPFDRINLGFEGLYGPRTMFYHLEPSPSEYNGRLVESLNVPVYDQSRVSAGTVEFVTLIVILSGFFWVLVKLRPAIGFWQDRKEAAEKKAQ